MFCDFYTESISARGNTLTLKQLTTTELQKSKPCYSACCLCSCRLRHTVSTSRKITFNVITRYWICAAISRPRAKLESAGRGSFM